MKLMLYNLKYLHDDAIETNSLLSKTNNFIEDPFSKQRFQKSNGIKYFKNGIYRQRYHCSEYRRLKCPVILYMDWDDFGKKVISSKRTHNPPPETVRLEKEKRREYTEILETRKKGCCLLNVKSFALMALSM